MAALIHHAKAKFGDAWSTNLHKNLPGAVKAVAEQFQVPVARVRAARARLMMAGIMIQTAFTEVAAEGATAPAPEEN